MAAALLLVVFALLAQFESHFSEKQLRIGAVFRKKQDAHLVAAFNYSLHWLHNRNILLSDGIPEREVVFGTVSGFMEILEDPEDYYELLEKACRLINERNVHALVGPAHLHQSELLADLSAKLRLPFFLLVDPLAHHFLNPSDGNLVRENASTATAAEAEAVHLEMFPHTQLLEAIIDLVKYWRWSRVIVVYRQPERIRRLIVFLESDALASIRFNLVNIEHDDFLGAAKRVKELEECGEMTNRQQQGQCSEFSRLLLDMDPHDTHQFLLAALKNSEAVHLEMFPHTQLLEAIIDLVKYWRWSRVIVVYRQPERIRRLIVFLESDALASIRFNLVNIEHDDFLGAAKRVKELEECGEMTNRQQQGQCSEFSRLLLDMDPHDTHQFLLAALKVGLVELKHWFLSTSLDLRNMDMELFRHNHAHFLGLDP
uniref:ANF_receptor domain-containing protein n=1 Tax=Globodera pallida TaxID=36090 RepID=A0A183CBT9_GLOPA